MKKILFLSGFLFLIFSCNNEVVIENPIEKFQKDLIEQGVTGSNVAQVYKDGKIIYNNISNSGALGDKDIDTNTIFPIWSMSKTVTTVAMMILLDQGMYTLDDNVEDYLPEYKNIQCKGPDGIYTCEKKLKIVHLLTHRSGYTYYANSGANWVTALHTDLYPAYTNTVRFNNLDDYSKTVSSIPLDFEPGTMYTYGLNQAILGRLVRITFTNPTKALFRRIQRLIRIQSTEGCLLESTMCTPKVRGSSPPRRRSSSTTKNTPNAVSPTFPQIMRGF